MLVANAIVLDFKFELRFHLYIGFSNHGCLSILENLDGEVLLHILYAKYSSSLSIYLKNHHFITNKNN
jgi:hypothetical protein